MFLAAVSSTPPCTSGGTRRWGPPSSSPPSRSTTSSTLALTGLADKILSRSGNMEIYEVGRALQDSVLLWLKHSQQQ